ncbi:DUF7010 family protein [Pseudoduganella sp. GCM10020061]|uniref:DUF7010 family protein n=1 Tax=Pseudoduganella sp. GCM10020061 TaxID=3317345 RepID=UPI00362FE48B
MTTARFDLTSSTISDAQRDMRHAYYGGAPGVLTSGLAWAMAALVCYQLSPQQAIWALFIGGMFIHPVAVVVTKMLGRPGNHTPGNPLGALAMASTIWMILCLPLAYGVSLLRIEWFFPAMLAIIGGRYLTFSTMYGGRMYWACGAALAIAGWLLFQAKASPATAAAAGAAIECVFAVLIFKTTPREGEVAVLAQST